MQLQPTRKDYGRDPGILRSTRNVKRGTVNIDSDDITADADGNKIVERNTLLMETAVAEFFKPFVSGTGDETKRFAILDTEVDVTDADASADAIFMAAEIYEDRIKPSTLSLSAADKAIIRHQFQSIY